MVVVNGALSRTRIQEYKNANKIGPGYRNDQVKQFSTAKLI